MIIASLVFGKLDDVSAQEIKAEPIVEDFDLHEISPFYIPTGINMTPRTTTIRGAKHNVLFNLSFSGDYNGSGYRWTLSPFVGRVYNGTTNFTSMPVPHEYQLSTGQMSATYSTAGSVVGISTATISGRITHNR